MNWFAAGWSGAKIRVGLFEIVFDDRHYPQTTNSSRPTSPTYRVLMIAPTSFFADYGCHVRILEEARVLQRLGHQVIVVTYANDNPCLAWIPGAHSSPWWRDDEVGSHRHKIAFDALLGLKTDTSQVKLDLFFGAVVVEVVNGQVGTIVQTRGRFSDSYGTDLNKLLPCGMLCLVSVGRGRGRIG